MTKAIILAGGMGTRLGKYTENLPKGMLEFLGKSLIQRQVDTLKKCGIEDIIITRKHFKEKINVEEVKYDDKTPDESNMLDDFFHAINDINEDIILSYGDIIFEANVLKNLVRCDADVCVVGDIDWKDYWVARLGDWMKDSESYMLGEKDKIIKIGHPNPKPEEMDARYVGLIKFSGKILSEIKKIYNSSVKEFWDKPWHTSLSFKKAYMTDFIQELIDRGFNVKIVKIKRGWMEFDTVEDYESAKKWAEEGTLNRFIKIN